MADTIEVLRERIADLERQLAHVARPHADLWHRYQSCLGEIPALGRALGLPPGPLAVPDALRLAAVEIQVLRGQITNLERQLAERATPGPPRWVKDEDGAELIALTLVSSSLGWVSPAAVGDWWGWKAGQEGEVGYAEGRAKTREQAIALVELAAGVGRGD